MPKLVIDIDVQFEAGPLMAFDKKSRDTKVLSPRQVKELLAGMGTADFSLNIVLLDPEEGWPSVGFDLEQGNLKKGGQFEVSVDQGKGTAKVHVKGEISSPPLRSGVAPLIQEMGKDADFRLAALNYKGGEKAGFTAPVVGQGEDDFQDWLKISKWELK